jgi:site-specific DNA recombinase
MNFGIKNPNSFYIYFRVSTPKQAEDNRNGLNIQTKICEKYALSSFGIKENQINYYCDVGSSYNNKSNLPNLKKMLRDLIPNSVILIYDVSRLGRNTFQVFSTLRRIRQLKCYVISVKDYITFGINRMSDKQFYHQVINSETESDIKSLKTIDRIKRFKKEKIHFGKIPFGYKIINKKLVNNISEQNIIKTLCVKYNEYKSFTKVADYYNKTTMLYRGKSWTVNNIRYLIKKFNKTKNIINSLENIINSLKNI